MSGLKYVLLGLATLSFNATAVAISVPPDPTASDIVIRTDLKSGEIQQNVGTQQWANLDNAMIWDPGVDFDRKSWQTAENETTGDIKPVGYGRDYRFRRGLRLYYDAPPCGHPAYSPPCAVPGFLYARPYDPDYYVYRRVEPALRIYPYRTYRDDYYYYQHFRRW